MLRTFLGDGGRHCSEAQPRGASDTGHRRTGVNHQHVVGDEFGAIDAHQRGQRRLATAGLADERKRRSVDRNSTRVQDCGAAHCQ